MALGSQPADGHEALAAGRWEEARAAFEGVLEAEDHADAHFGLAVASWWLGDSEAALRSSARAYALFGRAANVDQAVQCAVWLAITHKANFGNAAAANGWLRRAERLLEDRAPGVLNGWIWVAEAYQMADLGVAVELSQQACEVARRAGDVDLELTAMSQLGLCRVAQGDVEAGFALIDEASAAALAGEGTSLDTVVYACCDMLNACEITGDVERAAQWCQVADRFADTYGCPFLYAECRIYYGSILTAKGRWEAAERELDAGMRIAGDGSPGVHARGMIRLAALRIRQGRLEEAVQILAGAGDAVAAELELVIASAALLLSRGEPHDAARSVERRLHQLAEHRVHLVAGLSLLVDAHLAAGEVEAAQEAANRLLHASRAAGPQRAAALSASGQVAHASGDRDKAVSCLEEALELWSALQMPYEAAQTRFRLALACIPSSPDAGLDHAGRALSAFEELGASIDGDRVAAFLRSQGVVPRVGEKGVGVLTAREQEVLSLLAAGLSNPEIAERIHISRKTASHHVSSILSKLGLANRAQAAAYAAAAQHRGEAPPRTQHP